MSSFEGLPFIVIGGVTVLAALATALLPETKGLNMMSTVEEAEKLGDYGSFLGRLRRRSIFILKATLANVKKSDSTVKITENTTPL